MSAKQLDLFGSPSPPPPSEAYLAEVRSRLHATLALVKAAQVMPWQDEMTIIHEDNGFRRAKDLLPPEEGAALWAEFDVEMDRLYAIMNEGKEMPTY
jgi:hypothetical protein